MRIGIIGGLDRNEARYQRVAAREGHSLEWHNGRSSGRSVACLFALIARVELAVIVTDINSHTAVRLARQAVRQLGVPSLLLRRLGLARFDRLLQAHREREARAGSTAA